VCFNYRRKIPEFKPEQELQHGDPVEDDAREQDAEQFSGWKIFIKQDDVVPEIQVCLFMVVFGQGTTSNMVNGRLPAKLDLVAQVLNPPAKINLFHMCEKEWIQSPAPFI
jgi:hypothetical protein